MRAINLIVVHCSATREDFTLSPEDLDLTHRRLSSDLNGNGEIEPEEWIKSCPCFEVAKEFKEFGEFIAKTENTQEHRELQHIKEQKGGKLWQ